MSDSVTKDSHSRIDTRVEILTPENIVFSYRLAGPFRRLPAYLIDLTIRVTLLVFGATLVAIFLGLAGLGGAGMAFWMVAWFGLSWFYGGVFEALWNGQTPGKRMSNIRVISVGGEPINFTQALLRNILRAADALPMYTYSFGLLSAAMNDRFQRLGDLACGTMVVVESREMAGAVVRLQEPAVLRFAEQLPHDFHVAPSLARALSSYVSRRPYMNAARRFEVSRHLASALAEQMGVPTETNPDLLLCALYQRTFFGDPSLAEEEARSPFASASLSTVGDSPFGAATLADSEVVSDA